MNLDSPLVLNATFIFNNISVISLLEDRNLVNIKIHHCIEVTKNLYLGLHIPNKYTYTKIKKSKRVNRLSDRLKSFGLIHIRTPSHDESATESLKVGRVVNSNHFIVYFFYQHLRFAVATFTIETRVRLSATLRSCYNCH